MNNIIEDDEKNFLTELINMSFGLSASLIGDMFNSYVDLKIPSLNIIVGDEFEEFISKKFDIDKKYFISRQMFSSDFNGESTFVIDEKSAYELSRLMYKNLGIENDRLNEDDVLNSLLETTNILTSSCIGQLNEFMEFEVLFTPPSVALHDSGYITKYNDNLEYKHIIVIDTLLDLQDEHIEGYLFILTDEKFMDLLKKTMKNLGENGLFG